jgi:hypothetical protein
MYLLEQQLRLIDTWPTYIIRYLFVDVLSSPIFKRLAAFFYGNGVPVYTAAHLYWACNDTCNLRETNYMYLLYLHWQPCMYLPSMYKSHML